MKTKVKVLLAAILIFILGILGGCTDKLVNGLENIDNVQNDEFNEEVILCYDVSYVE